MRVVHHWAFHDQRSYEVASAGYWAFMCMIPVAVILALAAAVASIDGSSTLRTVLLSTGSLAAALFALYIKPQKHGTVLFLRGFLPADSKTHVRNALDQTLARHLFIVSIYDTWTNPVRPAYLTFAGGILGFLLGGIVGVIVRSSAPLLLFVPITVFIFSKFLPSVLLSKLEQERDVVRIADRVRKRGILARQGFAQKFRQSAIAVRAGDHIWTDAVLALAEAVDVILVDVIAFGQGLAWEVEQMLLRHPEKVVFISARLEIESITISPTPENPQRRHDDLGNASQLQHRFQMSLNNQTVLIGCEDSIRKGQFQNGLTAMVLEKLAQRKQ